MICGSNSELHVKNLHPNAHFKKRTCILSCKKWITGLGLIQDTGCLGLVHWDDPEGWCGEGGGRGSSGLGTCVHNWNVCCCFLIFILFIYFYFTLQYCIGFAIDWHESTTDVHEFPILNPLPPPTPYHFSGSSPCTSPKHPVSCIKHRLATRFYMFLTVSMPFSQVITPSPSPTESKSPFYISVSLLLSRIQGYHYHLSKFHIYALVYYIGVFLSGLLHSV